VKPFGALRKLLFFHGLATLAAAITLVVSPGMIPAVAGIDLDHASYLIAYLLAGAEAGLSFLSFGACRLTDARALRLIAWSCIVFHGTSAVLEVYVACGPGAHTVLWFNIAVRIVIIALFAFLARRNAGQVSGS
jgi:hypothetical protein